MKLDLILKYSTITLFWVAIGGCYRGVDTLETQDKEVLYYQTQMDRLTAFKGDVVEVQVNLHRWMTVPEIQALMNPNLSILQASVKVPRGSDPRSDPGYQLSVPVKGDLSNSIVAMTVETADILEAVSPDNVVDLRNRVLQDPEKSIFIFSMRVSGDPDELASWWVNSSDDIRFLQPVISSIDNAQHAFYPGEKLP